jgi:plasmid stabilization system protein ParE
VKVIISRSAERELEEIGDWIARDNPDRAASFVMELQEACRAIGLRPRAYPLVDGSRDPLLRRKVHGNYLIFYDVGASHIEILHVLHGARDYESLLFPEDER